MSEALMGAPGRLAAREADDGGIGESIRLVLGEMDRACGGVDTDAWSRAGDLLLEAPLVFTIGTGRSGLALQMGAMRLMHLGLAVHVVGETTAPAIGAGDVLVAASGSGTTGRVVRAAQKARECGASVIALTTAPDSPLARGATEALEIPAADKQDFDGTVSAQYAGSLFEQCVLMLTDSLFHTLWRAGGRRASDLWRAHANLE